MSLLRELSEWVAKKPLVLIRFNEADSKSLYESRRGMEKFSFARRHARLEHVKVPTLVIAEFAHGEDVRCFVGVAKSKRAVTTMDSSLMLVKLRQIDLISLADLKEESTEERFKTSIASKLKDGPFIASLSPKLSVHLLQKLLAGNRNRLPFDTAATLLPRLRNVTDGAWAQDDAIKMALATFGLGRDEAPDSVHISEGSDSSLRLMSQHVLEDNVIAADAAAIPGFEFIRRDLTGKAVFRNGDQQLEVFTANRGPLEEMFGVDLIYINEFTANVVMLQYKMLEASGEGGSSSDLVYRPDKQIEIELSRMKLPAFDPPSDQYRLHRSPFYLKFVERRSHGPSHKAFILSKDHYDLLLKLPESLGPRGGVRISYAALGGNYLREKDMVGLIRSGYVGTYRQESASLATLIEAVAQGARGLVLAWQKRLKSNNADNTTDFE
jgi:hypothetical protein